MQSKSEPKTTIFSQQHEEIRYDFRCPQCEELFEGDIDMDGETVDCACGCKFEVKS